MPRRRGKHMLLIEILQSVSRLINWVEANYSSGKIPINI
jgi:hypothetical protein